MKIAPSKRVFQACDSKSFLFASAGIRGFTLIELMITVAIAAIIAVVALPSYSAYLQKQKIRAAQSDLAGLVLQMENHFQQQLRYPEPTSGTAETRSVFPGWSPSQEEPAFDYRVEIASGRVYTLTATGLGRLSDCSLSITNENIRTSSGCGNGSGWL